MTEENMFRRLAEMRKESTQQPATPDPEAELTSSDPVPATPKKRGRPATGKRSDPDWIGRTYYIRRDTDLDVAAALLDLKRQGVEIDKSELVDRLLAAWVKWQQGENLESQLDKISPSRKGE